MSIFLYHDWMQLPLSTRAKLADKFGFKKIGATHVFNNEVQSDGYALKDVEKALNVEAIKAYLETEDVDLTKLWPLLIEKIEGRTPAVVPEVIPPVTEGQAIPVVELKQEVSQIGAGGGAIVEPKIKRTKKK